MKGITLGSRLGTALGAGLLATLALLPQAQGQLVYENNAAAQTTAAQVEDRDAMRQAIGASEKVQVTLQTQQPAPTELSPQLTAPAAAPVETENYSKAELMRRERQREELKNEDILQERLEELRLRDERRRTQEMLAAGQALPSSQQQLGQTAPAPQAASVGQTFPMKEEVVVPPVTERRTNASDRPSLAPAMAAPAMTDSVPMTQAGVSVAPGLEGTQENERTMITVAPHAGVSNIMGQAGYFEVHPRYAVGISAGISASEYIGFQVGYTYSQMGLSMASSNPFAAYAQQQAALYGQSNFQSINMNQNVFDAGIKLSVLGHSSRIRPFVGAGGAYRMSYINFSSSILQQMNQTYHANVSPDYKLTNFMGYLGGGMDFKITKAISVGAEFRYYAVLSDSQSSDLNVFNPVFYGGYGYYNGYGQQDTAIAGNSLARAGFYSILGTASFTF